MTFYPMTRNLYLTETGYNISPVFPFHIKVVTVNSPYAAHRHDFLELSFLIEGEGWQLINGISYPMVPGTFTFILPFQIHEIVPGPSGPLRLYNCMFDPDFLFQTSGVRADLKNLLFPKDHLPPSILIEDNKICRLMEEMLRDMGGEFRGDDLWRDDLLRIKLSEVLIRFDRLRRRGVSEQNEAKGTAQAKSVWSAVRYIQAHYQEPLTLSGVADAFDLNSSYLSAEFKRQTGLNFIRLLHEVRIRHSCSLLACTDMSVYEIAIEVGFGSYPSFLRIFRELKEITPSEYRRRFHPNEMTFAT